MVLSNGQSDPSSENEPPVLLSIAAPVFNEEAHIREIVLQWMGVLESWDFESEVILTNDGSTDKTGEILNQLEKEYSRVRVIHLSENRGYGYAFRSSIDASRGTYIATIDSDGQFELKNVGRLLPLLQAGEVDGVNGCRLRKQDSFWKVRADRVLNLFVRLLFRTKLRDTNCALKVIKRKLLQSLKLESTGFSFPTELVLKLERKGARLREEPVDHLSRAMGDSKVGVVGTSFRMSLFLFYLRFRFFFPSGKQGAAEPSI